MCSHIKTRHPSETQLLCPFLHLTPVIDVPKLMLHAVGYPWSLVNAVLNLAFNIIFILLCIRIERHQRPSDLDLILIRISIRNTGIRKPSLQSVTLFT
jgi:hypothetical protein